MFFCCDVGKRDPVLKGRCGPTNEPKEKLGFNCENEVSNLNNYNT